MKCGHKYLKIRVACQWKAPCFFSNSAAHCWPSEERTSFPTSYITHTLMLTLNHCHIVCDLISYIDLYFITSLVTGTPVYLKCTDSAMLVLVPGNDCVLVHWSFFGCSSCLSASFVSSSSRHLCGKPWIIVLNCCYLFCQHVNQH